MLYTIFNNCAEETSIFHLEVFLKCKADLQIIMSTVVHLLLSALDMCLNPLKLQKARNLFSYLIYEYWKPQNPLVPRCFNVDRT